MSTAILGSAFDPPHLGHIDVLQQLENRCDNVIIVPAFAHAFNKPMSKFEHRVEMLRLILAHSSNDIPVPWSLSVIEEKLCDGINPVYTWDVLQHFKATLPDQPLAFVIGPDNQANWHKFYKSDEIEQEFSLIHVQQRLAIRSTLCRARPKNLSAFVGDDVARYINEHQLYRRVDQAID